MLPFGLAIEREELRPGHGGYVGFSVYQNDVFLAVCKANVTRSSVRGIHLGYREFELTANWADGSMSIGVVLPHRRFNMEMDAW